MSFIEMKVAPTKKGEREEFSFEQKISLTTVSNSDWIMIPGGIISIAVTLVVTGGGKGKVQSTTDSIEIVKSGSGITPIDWDFGEVDINTQDSCVPVTAIRLVQTFAGTIKLTVRAQ